MVISTSPAGRSNQVGWVVAVAAEHGAVEDGPGSGNAGEALHRLLFEISRPHADGEFRGEADAPVVVEIGGGAGFHGAAERQVERAAGLEGRRAGGGIGEDVGDEIGVANIEHRTSDIEL